MPNGANTTRVTHLITSLGGGGTENFLFQILSGSPQAYKHRVCYLGHDGVNGDRIRRLGISVERVRPVSFYHLLREERPDVLHTCLHWAHQVGRITGHLAKVPFILSSQRSIDTWQRPWHRLMDRWTLPYSHAIAANSDAAREVVERKIHSAAHRPRLYKVANGLDFAAFTPLDRDLARNRFQIPSDALVGGTLMRLHAEKGAEKLPAFAEALLESHPRLILLIGGTGPLEAGLKRQTQRWGNRIRWLGWQEESLPFLSALDFFWLLSREESFPQALLEASGTGIPWTAPDVGGVRELLEAGAFGLIYPSKDIAAAVANANRLLENSATNRAQARDAILKLKTHYDLSAMVKVFYAIVESRGR